MTPDLLVLIGGMAIVTYATRSLPLLVPGVERLPALALAYLRLVGPATLAALVVAQVLIATDADGRSTFRVGIEVLAIVVCLAVVLCRRVLPLGLVAAVAVVAIGRAVGLG